MKQNSSPSPSPVPAARRVRQMGEKIDVLQAKIEDSFSEAPCLLYLLMRLIAFLRRFADGLPTDVVEAAVAGKARPNAEAPVAQDGRRGRAPRARAISIETVMIVVAEAATPADSVRPMDDHRRSFDALPAPLCRNFFKKSDLPTLPTHAIFVTISKQNYLWMKFSWFFSFKKRTPYFRLPAARAKPTGQPPPPG